MNPNDDENEYISKDDNKSDIWFMTKALELHEMKEQEEMGQTSNSREPREYDVAEERLMRDYFGDFRRRNRMSRKLFLEIVEDQKMSISSIDFNEMYVSPHANMRRTCFERCEVQRRKAKELLDRETHESLQQNIMEQH
nr:hypothetical protein [Tanacetum cinerariifolium]